MNLLRRFHWTSKENERIYLGKSQLNVNGRLPLQINYNFCINTTIGHDPFCINTTIGHDPFKPDYQIINKSTRHLYPQKKPHPLRIRLVFLGGRPGSNRRPLEPQSSALTS